MGKSSSTWALLLLVPCVLAGPLLQNSCSTECRTPSNPKFRYASGQTYAYNFQASSKTWMMGTSEDQAVLDVKGQALVTFRSSCDAVLHLRQATISGLQEQVDASELQKRPLSFTWQDGTVESLCPDQEDPAWVVNIKRSVLSMLQHTAQFIDVPESHVVESDVIGRCPTEYTVEAVGKSIKVTKTKIPNQCSHRIDRQSSIPTIAYHVSAETQTVPLMNSTTICQMQIKENVIQATECIESHVFRPLSTEKGGARTDVTSSISLISTSAAIAAKLSSNRSPSTLLLDPRGVQQEFQDAKDVNTVVRSICQHLASDSPAQVAQLFTELVHSLRKASPKEVKAAYNNLRGKKICPESTKTEKMFLDALPQAGSTGSISLMADLLKENKLSSRQAMGWYMSLPLSKHADIDAIKAVLPLVESSSNSPVALLGLTGLVRRYCIHKMEECQSIQEIQQFSTKLSKLLGAKCQVDAKNEVKAISVLKALGNLGVMTSEVRSTVAECAKDANLPATVRLAAIEASRNNPCDKQMKEQMLNILEDRKEDAEIRIAAYQAVMRCPCSPSMLRIQNLLNTEETNQVGSYIVSHMNNIKLNSSPSKENARRLVKKLSLERSFPFDLRKYSRNMVVNHFCPSNNAGWDIDTSVVYTPKSFLPRSASMNLTLDLFGQSVNLLEFGVRAENLERILEAYLGPDGVLEKEGIAGLLEKSSDSVSKFGENVWNRVASATRSKRANIKANELSNLDKLVSMKEKPAGIKLDAFLRVFGSEVGMVNYRGASNAQPKLELLSGLESRIAEAWRDLIEGAKRVEVDVARSVMFLDSSVTFPTVAGFPLRLAVNGTTTVGLGLESKMDLPALLRDPMNADIRLKVNPLAVTEVSASMTVDISIVKTGIKLATTIHSSMAADFTARMQQGTTVEVKLDLPKSKMTIVEFNSNVMLVEQTADKNERNKPLTITNEATFNRGGCSERLSSVTGMRMCATSSVSVPRPMADPSSDPTPAFPFSGTGSFAIVLEKTEPTMTGYILSATSKQEGPKATSFLMMFDTPGSRTNRKISIKGMLTSAPTMSLKVDSKAPWGNMAAEVEMINRADVKSVMLKATTQEKREYYGKVQVNVARGSGRYSLATTVEAGWPQQARAIIMEGGFGHEIGRSVELSLKPSGPYAKLPYAFQVTIGREMTATVQKFWLTNFQLATPLGSVLLSTEVGRQERNLLATLNMKYGTEQKMHAVSFNGHVQSTVQTAEKSASYKSAVMYKSSRFPRMNVDLKLDIQTSPTMMSNTLVLVHGPEIEQNTNRLYFNKYIQMRGNMLKKDFAFENKLEVTYPRYAINFKMDQSIKVDERLAKGLVTFHMDNIKLVDGDFALVIKPKDPKNMYELATKLTYPGRTIVITDVGKRIDRNSFSMSPVLDIQPGRKIELNGKTSLINDQNGISLNVDSEMRVSGFSSPIKVRHSFQYTDDKTLTTSNKVEWAGQPQLVLDGKVFLRTRSMPAVEMVFMWNNLLEAKMDAHMSKTDSKMDLDVNLLRLQRRIKVASQHKFMGDTRSGSFNVAWDADKDSSKQVGFDGSFTLSATQRLIDLKSSMNIENRIYSVALNGKLGAEYMNGEHGLNMEVQMPAMKKMMLHMGLFNVYQAKKISNRLEVETQMPTGSLYQMSLSNAVNDLDRSLYTYTAITELSVKSNAAEDIKIRMDSKRAIKGDKRNTDFKTLVIAPKWGQNIDSSLNIEMAKDSFRVGSKYQRGPMLFTVESVGKRARVGGKLNLEGSVEVKAPKTTWQQAKVALVSSYDITSISNFDISERLTIEYQSSKTITLDNSWKVSPSTVDISLMLETPYQAARRQGVTLSARFEPNNPRSEGSFVVTWSAPGLRQPQEARIDVEMERRSNQLRFKLTTSSPIKKMENSEFSFDIRSLEDSQVREIDLIAEVSDKKAKLSGRLNLSPAQRELDLTLSLPTFNPLRVLARIETQSSTHIVETRIDWGTGTFNVEGTTKIISADNFEVDLKIHSPELGVNNFVLKAVNKLQNKQRVTKMTIMRKSSSLVVFDSVYDRKDDRTGVHVSGTAEVSLPESEFSGTIKYSAESRLVDSAEEKGKLYKFDVDLSEGLIVKKTNGHLKVTNKEKSASLALCGTETTCEEISVAYKDTGIKSAVGKEAYLLIKSKEDGTQQVRGLRTKLASSTPKFEHTFEILLDEAKSQIVGYKMYKKDKEYGLEVYSPKRISAATVEIVSGGIRMSNKVQYILSIWLDKVKAPERKLVIATTVEPHKMGNMEGMTTSTLIKHPMLSKDLECKLEYHIGKSGRDLFHVKIDADVLDPKHQRWSLETRVKNLLAESNGRNITVDMELRSKGADIAALLSLYAGRTADHFYTTGATLKLKEKERVEKELFVRLDANRESAALTLGSPVKQMTVEGRWSVDKIVSFQRLQLSASTHIFGLPSTVYVVDMNTSPHVDIRVFTKGSSDNYYQLVGGLLDDSRFELALIRQQNVQRKELVAVYVSLTRSDLLSTRITWKIEDLRALLSTIRTRSRAIAEELTAVRSSLTNDLSPILLKWKPNANLKATYDKVAVDVIKQLKQIRTEFEEDESMKEAVEIVENIVWGIKYLGEIIEVVIEQWEGKSDIAEAFERFIDNMKERVVKYVRTVSETAAQMLEDIVRYLEQWRIQYGKKEGILSAIQNFVQFKSKEIEQFMAMVSARLQKVVSWVEGLKFGERNVIAALREIISNANVEAIRERVVNFLDETVLLPYEGFLMEVAKAYPETTRPVYRYGQQPIRKIRFYLKRSGQVTKNIVQVAASSVADKGSLLPSWIGEVVVYDVKNGEIRYQLPLNRKLTSLRELGKVFESQKLKSLAITSSLRDMYREMRAKYDPSLAAASIYGHASLIGSKGLITFDKKSFDLSGASCQYLLARDFLNMDFAVAVNFEQSSGDVTKKSVIFTDGEDQVEIKDSQVYVNNKLAILPAELKKTTVQRVGDVIVVRRSSHAILRCNTHKDICSFELSPFYAGRTMGLWGTFTNEHADDLAEPTGKVSKDVSSFVNSWKINKSCRDNIQTVVESPQLIEAAVDVDECTNKFAEKDSELSSCFSVVSPAPYHDLCLKFAYKAKKSESTFQRQMESLIADYRVTCQRWDVSL